MEFNDPCIKIDDVNVTTDKIVSLMDYGKICKAFDVTKLNKVLEIGAGSGRTCEAILLIEKNFKYFWKKKIYKLELFLQVIF